MPLLPGKSKAAFSKNVATEMKAGKPQNQSLAIAYATRKRNRKAEGGHVHGPMCAEGCMMAEGGMLTKSGYQAPTQRTKPQAVVEQSNIPLSQAMLPDMTANDELTKQGYQKPKEETTFSPIHEQTNLDLSHQSSARKMSERAMDEDDRALNQHGDEEEGPTGTRMAEGGDVPDGSEEQRDVTIPELEHTKELTSAKSPEDGTKENFLTTHGDPYGGYAEGGSVLGEPTDAGEDREESFITDNLQDASHMRDMVGRIMAQRQRMYSEGGKVANQEHGHNDNELAGFSPNEFDDLVLRDDLEQSYTGANSGDEDGDHRSHAEDDRVSRIMLKRRKQTNPRPA